MTKAEQFAKQDDVIVAAELGLELIPEQEKMSLYMQAEFAGVNRVLDTIDPPRGKKDEKSYRQLLVAAGIECLRRATAIRPVRVEHFKKAWFVLCITWPQNALKADSSDSGLRIPFTVYLPDHKNEPGAKFTPTFDHSGRLALPQIRTRWRFAGG